MSASPEKAVKAKKVKAPATPQYSVAEPQPFRVSTAYNYYVKEFAEEWNEKYPERKREAFTEGGKVWKAMSEAKKEVYNKMNA